MKHTKTVEELTAQLKDAQQYALLLEGSENRALAQVKAMERELGNWSERESEGRTIDIVFDSVPGPLGPHFVEVESPPGTSIRFAEWVRRADGYQVLRFEAPGRDEVEYLKAKVEAAERLYENADHCSKEGYLTDGLSEALEAYHEIKLEK